MSPAAVDFKGPNGTASIPTGVVENPVPALPRMVPGSCRLSSQKKHKIIVLFCQRADMQKDPPEKLCKVSNRSREGFIDNGPEDHHFPFNPDNYFSWLPWTRIKPYDTIPPTNDEDVNHHKIIFGNGTNRKPWTTKNAFLPGNL